MGGDVPWQKAQPLHDTTRERFKGTRPLVCRSENFERGAIKRQDGSLGEPHGTLTNYGILVIMAIDVIPKRKRTKKTDMQQLVKDSNDPSRFRNVLVPKRELRKVLEEAKAARDSAGFLLNGVSEILFPPKELASAKGITKARAGEAALDEEKVDALFEPMQTPFLDLKTEANWYLVRYLSKVGKSLDGTPHDPDSQLKKGTQPRQENKEDRTQTEVTMDHSEYEHPMDSSDDHPLMEEITNLEEKDSLRDSPDPTMNPKRDKEDHGCAD
ncbi:hypothetical protein NDU88_003225 [Pleurodeles waltl]|uniref:Uncharacterized protein n=1 Tax=Pleurodeles waltl TaxID=8319 RepID=A0AAV7UXU4_PLEWA|nr:hypothetical protein NDU88_003225 [Pleurodeles waltl]